MAGELTSRTYEIGDTIGVVGVQEVLDDQTIRVLLDRVTTQVLETYRRDRAQWGARFDFEWKVTAR